VLEDICTNQSDDEDSDDEDQEEEDEPVEECTTSETCILSPLTSSKEPLNNKITLTDSAQENSVVPVYKTGGTGFDRGNADDHSSIKSSTSHQPSEVSTAPSHSFLNNNSAKCLVTRGKKKKGSEIENFDFELDKMTKKDKKNVLELIKRVRKQSDELTGQQKYHESFKKELEKVKEEYGCVTNTLV